MSLIASSGLGALLSLLVVLACPLMMVFMMRGMHGGHGHAGHGGHGHGEAQKPPRDGMSLDELKRERDELNDLIMDRAEQETARR